MFLAANFATTRERIFMAFNALARYLSLTPESSANPRLVAVEEQNSNYESAVVQWADQLWRIRTARITNTKPGAFLACWTRNAAGQTVPFSAAEPMAGLIVFVEEGEQFGIFKFPREQLHDLGVTSSEISPGKRGFRVYPSWCTALNPQARRTQLAQSSAFRLV